MPPTLDADVALIHVAGGAPRATPPPGSLAQTAPRRAARGRAEDMLFLTLGLQSAQSLAAGLIDHLAQRASEAYFATPGSVTAALRQASTVVNEHLLDVNQARGESTHVQGRLMLAVLRGRDLYLAQCGAGQAVVVRQDGHARLTSEEAAARPLGLAVAPFVRYNHLEAQPGDLLVLTTAPPPLWSDPALSGLAGLDLAQAVERLGGSAANDLTAVAFRVASPGELVSLPARPAPAPRRPAAVIPPQPTPTPRPAFRSPHVRARGATLTQALAPALARLEAIESAAAGTVVRLLARMAPGLVEPSETGGISPVAKLATALAVPLILAAIGALVYFRLGRGNQFEAYLAQAQTAAAAAQVNADPAQARAKWDLARQYLDLAEKYGSNSDSTALRQIVQQTLDQIDMIFAVDYRPAVSGGFGAGARLTGLAATASDLYVLDSAQQVIWHAWATGRGYEIDRDFKCLKGKDSVKDLGEPVALTVQPEPGALGVEGVVAIDAAGRLLYCAPGRSPLTGALTPPSTGWGRIQAIDVNNGKLYVLDPKSNAVWVYDATDGLFSGSPYLFFTDAVPDLKTAVHLAMTQTELFVLHDNGRLDRCAQKSETATDGTTRLRVDCEKDTRFTDERNAALSGDHIPGASPAAVVYGSPPEPSLYFLDRLTGSVYHYSMRLVYQGVYQPKQPLRGDVTALALGPPNDLFVAAGSQVYLIEPVQ